MRAEVHRDGRPPAFLHTAVSGAGEGRVARRCCARIRSTAVAVERGRRVLLRVGALRCARRSACLRAELVDGQLAGGLIRQRGEVARADERLVMVWGGEPPAFSIGYDEPIGPADSGYKAGVPGPGLAIGGSAASTGRTVLDAAMAQPPPVSEHADAADEAPQVPTSPSDLIRHGARRWLQSAHGWRGGAPRWVRPPGPSLWAGSPRNCSTSPRGHTFCSAAATRLSRSGCRSSAHNASASWSKRCEPAATPLRFRTVALFTIGGVALAVMTVVLVLAQI